jgi:ABC-type Fe3+-siderophore transport system permease subunit
MVRLNGWRRIALAMSILWIGIALTTAGLDYFNKSDGYFVFQSIPIGTVMTPSSIKLPDGTTISRDEEKEFEQRLKAEQASSKLSGKPVPKNDLPVDLKKPWNMDWSKQANVPIAWEIRWPRLLFAGLAMPLLLWMFAELYAVVLRWIIRGFRKSEPPTDA